MYNIQYMCMCFRALRVRKKMAGERMPVQVVGDILSSELSHMQAYIRFCSCQLNAAALLQQKTDKSPDFKLFLKVNGVLITGKLHFLVDTFVYFCTINNFGLVLGRCLNQLCCPFSTLVHKMAL